MKLNKYDWFYSTFEKTVKQADDIDIVGLDDDECLPIELTKEHLIKNGFIKREGYKAWELEIGRLMISITCDLCDIYGESFDSAIPKIKYEANINGLSVHELQRVLRIYGYNNLADHFKI